MSLIAALLLAAGGQGLLGRPCLAQEAGDDARQEKAWKIETVDKKISLTNKMTILRRGKFEGEEESDFEKYYKGFSFPRWTAPEYRSRQPWNGHLEIQKDIIGEIRRELNDAEKAPDKQVYQKLCALVLEYMVPLAKGTDYHPLTRYNAMAAIAELNVPEAVPAFVDAINDPKQSDVVKVTAMIGLIRHANPKLVGITDAETLATVTKAMTTVAEAPVPDGDKADGVRWLRGQAAEVLGLLGSPGRNGAVATALLKMIADPRLYLSQRVKAAAALGDLNWSGASMSAGPCLEALGGLAVDVVAVERQGSPSRRRVVGNAQNVLAGLKAADALAKADEKKLADGLRAAVEPLLDSKVTPEDLKQNLETATEKLAELVKKRSN